MDKPHAIPESLVDRITTKGGKTPDGQPMFRVMWAPEVTEIRGQRWKDRDSSNNVIREVVEYRKAPKYDCDRWIFEMWTPTPMSEQEWNDSNTEYFDGLPFLKLPYPRHGEYELMKIIQTPTGGFIPLTSTICDALVHTAVMNRHLPEARRVAYLDEQRKKKEAATDQRRMDIVQDARRLWGAESFVTVPKQI